ncbi:MAG TPA: hypothetical protein VF691_04195 [Cytophagaceae bacterium]|jgi:hypothetical protein
MTFEIETRGVALELHLTVVAKTPCVISIIGYDATSKHTVYFNRGYGFRNLPDVENVLLQGEKVFKIPMPLTPSKLSIKLSNDIDFANVTITKAEAKPLKRKEVWMKEADRDFINFAYEFAREAGTIAAGKTWGSDSERFVLRYLPVLKNRETGQVLSTPARINRITGVIEVARDKFVRFTVFMRVIILFHEYFHYDLDTRSEQKADFNAIAWALGLGFPRTEVMYAFTKVFGNVKALQSREIDNINFIKNYELIKE